LIILYARSSANAVLYLSAPDLSSILSNLSSISERRVDLVALIEREDGFLSSEISTSESRMLEMRVDLVEGLLKNLTVHSV
jgi:hypothetical protein